MPKITIQNLFDKEIFVQDENKNLLEIIHENNVDWMHACGKKGRCTTCKAIVTSGLQNLSDLSEVEKKFRLKGKLAENERLTCQCVLHDDIQIKVADENKFFHLEYSS